MLVRELLRLNVVALIAASLFFVSTLFPWWGLDISGPTYGISYSLRWNMWIGPLVMLGPPPQAYSWVDYLNQVLSSGTSIIGTLALGTADLPLVGRKLGRTRFFLGRVASLVLITLLFVSVVHSSFR